MCGVGKFFEGNAKLKWESIETFKQRVPETSFFFHAHEYAQCNLEFSLKLDRKNKDLILTYETVKSNLSKGVPNVGHTIGDELKINMFLNADQKWVQDITGYYDAVETLSFLRVEKDKETAFNANN